MSLAEIKSALRDLDAQDLAELEETIAQIRTERHARVRYVRPSDPDFLAAKEKIFTDHHELFRKLAE